MAYLDFEAIKANNPIDKVAERLGLELKKNGAQLRGPCFSGQGDHRSLVITPAKSAWYSFALSKGGDAIALVAAVKEMSTKEAAQWLQGDTVPEKKKPEQPVKEEVQSEERGFRELDYLQPEHEACEAIGFDIDDLKRLRGGYAPRGVMRGTVCIPVRDTTGKLLGYLGCRDVVLPKQWQW